MRSTIFPFLCSRCFLLSMCSLWVYVFYGFYVGLAKLHCGATPPSVMVLFVCLCMALASPGVPRFFNVQNPSLGRDSFSQAWIFHQFSIRRFKFEATNSISCLTSTPSEVQTQYFFLKVKLTAKCVFKFSSKPLCPTKKSTHLTLYHYNKLASSKLR